LGDSCEKGLDLKERGMIDNGVIIMSDCLKRGEDELIGVTLEGKVGFNKTKDV
jgi:hypothetical protein